MQIFHVHCIFLLHPASVVEVTESVSSVCLSAWVCGSYLVRHFVGTELLCAPPTCITLKLGTAVMSCLTDERETKQRPRRYLKPSLTTKDYGKREVHQRSGVFILKLGMEFSINDKNMRTAICPSHYINS